MASREHTPETPPPYSRHPFTREQTLATAPDFPLAVDAIQLVQERFPGTSAGDAWEFVQQLAILVRTDVHNRRGRGVRASGQTASNRARESDPPSVIPENSPMPDAVQ